MSWESVLKRRAYHKRINTVQLYKRVLTNIRNGQEYRSGDRIYMTSEKPTGGDLISGKRHFFHRAGVYYKGLAQDMVYTIASDMWANEPFDNGQTRKETFTKGEYPNFSYSKRFYENELGS